MLNMKVIYNNNNQLPIKAIICPRCGSKDLAIITEYHKSIICRVLKIIGIVFLFFGLVNKTLDFTMEW